jgi:hypothetical protein
MSQLKSTATAERKRVQQSCGVVFPNSSSAVVASLFHGKKKNAFAILFMFWRLVVLSYYAHFLPIAQLCLRFRVLSGDWAMES